MKTFIKSLKTRYLYAKWARQQARAEIFREWKQGKRDVTPFAPSELFLVTGIILTLILGLFLIAAGIHQTFFKEDSAPEAVSVYSSTAVGGALIPGHQRASAEGGTMDVIAGVGPQDSPVPVPKSAPTGSPAVELSAPVVTAKSSAPAAAPVSLDFRQETAVPSAPASPAPAPSAVPAEKTEAPAIGDAPTAPASAPAMSAPVKELPEGTARSVKLKVAGSDGSAFSVVAHCPKHVRFADAWDSLECGLIHAEGILDQPAPADGYATYRWVGPNDGVWRSSVDAAWSISTRMGQ